METYLQWRKRQRRKELQEEQSSSTEIMRSDSSQVFVDRPKKKLKDILNW